MSLTLTLPVCEDYSLGDFLRSRSVFNCVPAVYVLRDSAQGVLYVGKSASVGRRVVEHSQGKGDAIHYCRDIEHVSIYRPENMMLLDIYETLLIHELKPSHNRDKVFSREHVLYIEEELCQVEDLISQAEDVRRWLRIEIDEFESFAEESYYDPGVIRTEWAELIRNLEAKDREISRLVERRLLLRNRATRAGRG